MAEPFADSAYFEENFGAPPPKIAGRLDQELARASRYVRGELPGIDERITAGRIDPDLVADVVCEMVKSAASSAADTGIDSLQQAAGPFSTSIRYTNPVGDLYLTKKQRRLLGYGGARAASIDLLATEDNS